MSENLAADAQETAACLQWLLGSSVVHIEYMSSEGAAPPRVVRVSADDTGALISLINKWNGDAQKNNMYWVPDGFQFRGGKRKKANLEEVEHLHVDIDFKDYPGTPEEQRQRAQNFVLDPTHRPASVPEPTLVWETGGGLQAIWKLETPVTIELAQRANLMILQKLEGGAGTHDPGRLIRLPGTMNWLNVKKRKEGREPALGKIVVPANFDLPPQKYSIEEFDLNGAPSSVDSAIGTNASKRVAARIKPSKFDGNPLSALPDDPDWLAAISKGVKPPKKNFPTRSELLFGCTIWMLSNGLSEEKTLGILLEPSLAIGDHIRDRCTNEEQAARYAERQIRRAQGVISARTTTWPNVGEKGFPVNSDPQNIRHALSLIGVSVFRNEFSNSDEFEGRNLENRDFNDIADILCSIFQRELHFSASSAAIRRELMAVAHENRQHPILEYLDAQVWDGVARLDTWLIRYCGVDDTPLHREFAAKTLIGAVRRIRSPGTKFDTMLVLEGSQGVGKSKLLRILAVRTEWFCESMSLRADDRERAQILQRGWIIENQEMDGINKVGAENLKKFLSESVDTYRRPYEKNARQHPRHCILIGTTNQSRYLLDRTGNRRFWPVKTQEINLSGFASELDQLWAEAAHREAAGESITLSEHLWEEAAKVQELRLNENPFEGVLESALGGLVGKISMESVKIILGMPFSNLRSEDSKNVKDAMQSMGWSYSTYRMWVPSRGETWPVRGFSNDHSNTYSREIAARANRDGGFDIGYINTQGYFSPLRGGLSDKDDVPF